MPLNIPLKTPCLTPMTEPLEHRVPHFPKTSGQKLLAKNFWPKISGQKLLADPAMAIRGDPGRSGAIRGALGALALGRCSGALLWFGRSGALLWFGRSGALLWFGRSGALLWFGRSGALRGALAVRPIHTALPKTTGHGWRFGQNRFSCHRFSCHRFSCHRFSCHRFSCPGSVAPSTPIVHRLRSFASSATPSFRRLKHKSSHLGNLNLNRP